MDSAAAQMEQPATNETKQEQLGTTIRSTNDESTHVMMMRHSRTRSRPISVKVESKPDWEETITLPSSRNNDLPKASRVYFREATPSIHVDPLAQLNPQLRRIFNRAAAAYVSSRDPAYSTLLHCIPRG